MSQTNNDEESLVAVPVGEELANDADHDDHHSNDSGSNSSSSEAGDHHEERGGDNDLDDDALLGVTNGAAAASAVGESVNGEGDIIPEKKDKHKDKKSKKDKHKDKKSKKDKHKDKKSKKDKHKDKKEKHKSKRDREDDGLDGYMKHASDEGAERRRRRRERETRNDVDGDANENTKGHSRNGGGGGSSHSTKRGTSVVELNHLKSLLEAALVPTGQLENGASTYDNAAIHEVLVQLAGLHVTYEHLAATRIGATVGKLLAPEFQSAMQRPFANAILLFWFSRLSQDNQKQLVRVDELENASVASQFDDREDVEEMAKLGRVGIDIERIFTVDELNLAGTVDASHVAGELSDLLATAKDAREEVLNRLRAPENRTLRVKLLKGEVQAGELVNHPEIFGASESQRRRNVEQEEVYLRTHAVS